MDVHCMCMLNFCADSPAAKSGIRPGDKLLVVDDCHLEDMTQADINVILQEVQCALLCFKAGGEELCASVLFCQLNGYVLAGIYLCQLLEPFYTLNYRCNVTIKGLPSKLCYKLV